MKRIIDRIKGLFGKKAPTNPKTGEIALKYNPVEITENIWMGIPPAYWPELDELEKVHGSKTLEVFFKKYRSLPVYDSDAVLPGCDNLYKTEKK